ncbi:hypothetical protein ABT061_35860 [Streptosporangium sp. NPDC002544]
MNGFLSEIGKKLAERWVTLLALPGLLYLAAAMVGHTRAGLTLSTSPC